ncbi:MAG: hypothetical protein M3Y56_04305 [Armatimonadota bacterium]|nr:hypothetical protein [Armatimonadota bacterium]
MRQYPGMKQYHGVAAGAFLLAGSLLWGCGNSSVPEEAVGSIAGQVTNRGPVSLVRLRQIIPGPVNSPVNSDGSFRFSAPQGLATLEFLDSRQIPFSYAEVYVQPNGTYTLPQPAIGPGDVPSPDPSVNGGIGANGVPIPGVSTIPQVGFTGYIDPTAAGNLSIRAFGPNGALLPVGATVRLYNPNIQGGPTGSVGQNPSTTNPGLVSGNSAGIAASRSRQASAGDGSTGGTGGTGASTSGATATSTTDTSSTGGGGSTGSAGGAATTTAGALSAGGVATGTTSATTGTTAATTGAGTSSGTATTSGAVTTTGAVSTSGATGGTTSGSTGSTEQNQLGAQTAPFVNFQNAILATVVTNLAGAVSISGIPTGAPGLVTPGAVSAFSSSTDAAGNVTLTTNAAAAASINPTGGEYQLVPLPVTLNGQTLYARQILLDVLPGVTTHVDLLYTPVQ